MFADDTREWLEADGLGGFASGTVSGIRTRRYHALLLTATTPPTGRMVLVNGFDAWVEYGAPAHSDFQPAIHNRHRPPGRCIEDGELHRQPVAGVESTSLAPGLRLRQEIVVPHERAAVLVTWRLVESPQDETPIPPPGAAIPVGPGLPLDASREHRVQNCRFHQRRCGHMASASEERARRGQPRQCRLQPRTRLVPAVPLLRRAGAGPRCARRPAGARTARVESPEGPGAVAASVGAPPPWTMRRRLPDVVSRLRDDEQARRAAFASPLHRAADAYLVRRGDGRTIRGRLPMVHGLGSGRVRPRVAVSASTRAASTRRATSCSTWSAALSDGMLPNRFPDRGETPEFNSVDASLWFVTAVRDLCAAVDRGEGLLDAAARSALLEAAHQVLNAYFRGDSIWNPGRHGRPAGLR